MIFVEGFRLLFVLAGSVAGFEIGRHVGMSPNGSVTGLVLGAAITYVLGGTVGRLLDQGLQRAVQQFRRAPPGEIFAAMISATTAMLLGLVIVGLPLHVLLSPSYALLVTAVVTWVLASLGWRIGALKGRQIVHAAGLSHILAPQPDPPDGPALLVDSSAVMDRFLLVLGRAGLLPGGLVVPQFVIDQVRTIAESPDPVQARRARRGLESLEALRAMDIDVYVPSDEVPGIDDPTVKVLTVARRIGLRIGTCSAHVVELAGTWELPVVDLRSVAADLSPDHLPGEVLFVELLREGRQPRQAVGYLPEGDMVVVNDAVHLIGRGMVAVNVLQTRSTSQGLLVFARLSDGPVEMPGESLPAGDSRRSRGQVRS